MTENEVDENDRVELQIRNATKVLESLLGDNGNSFVDLLHVNCEVQYISIHQIYFNNISNLPHTGL